MFKIFYLLVSILLIIKEGRAQSIIVNGRIVDRSNASIPYVNISLNHDPTIGTYSNSDGRFEIKANKGDTIVFSCIGYENKMLNISGYTDSIRVTLDSKTYFLDEITIRTDSASEIVENAISSLRKNLPTEKNILQGFFREVIRSDYTYDRLVEAAVDIFDKGYTPAKGNENLLFKIRELRKSEDYLDLDWKASIMNYLSPKNGLHGNEADALFYHDYIRNNKAMFFELMNAPLNKRFLDFVELTVDSTVIFYQDTLFCVNICPKDLKGDFLPSGTIYIRKGDYAVYEMDLTMRLNSQNEQLKNLPFVVPGQDFIFRTIIKYKEYREKMYLSFLYRKSFRQQLNYTKSRKTKGKEGYFYDEKLFITNEIITEKGKFISFKKKERQSKNIDLYSEEWKYNESFWRTYNVLNENPLMPNIRNDLEREVSLDEQFQKKNE